MARSVQNIVSSPLHRLRPVFSSKPGHSMGVELVLSLHLPPSNSATAHKFPSSILLAHIRSFPGVSGRRQSLLRSAISNLDASYSDWIFQTIQCQHLQGHQPCSCHHQPCHHHTEQGSIHAKKPFAGLHSGSLICDNNSMDQEEHAITLNFFLHDSECVLPKGDKCRKVCGGQGAVAGVNLPTSIRMLKKKQLAFGKSGLVSGLSDLGNSLHNAFSSIMFIMKTLQSHTLEIRRKIFRHEIGGILGQVQTEMRTSFLWLFQQVFSCTPELMVLIMVLLADFTAFSVVNNLYTLPRSLYDTSPLVAAISTAGDSLSSTDEGFRAYHNNSFTGCPSLVDGDSHYSHIDIGGNGGTRGYASTGRGSGDSDDYKSPMNMNKVPWSVDESIAPETSSSQVSGFPARAAVLALEEVGTANDVAKGKETLASSIENHVPDSVESKGTRESGKTAINHYLDQGMMIGSSVTPNDACIQDDHYACYDKTDLGYREAIGSDSMNSMLLSNYAQFLFLVRKDHDRAEELFRKAILCDPFDCDAISRFASFLWLARHNVAAAEKAYSVAACTDPTNAFHAAMYAHFLWNSGLEEM